MSSSTILVNALEALNHCLGQDTDLLARFNEDPRKCLYNKANSKRCYAWTPPSRRDTRKTRKYLDRLSQLSVEHDHEEYKTLIPELAKIACCCKQHENGLIDTVNEIEGWRVFFWTGPSANLRTHDATGTQIRSVTDIEHLSSGMRFALHPKNKGSPSSAKVRTFLERKAQENFRSGPRKGFIYAYCYDSRPGYTKIGHTTSPVDKYLSEQERKCRVRPGSFRRIYQSPEVSHPGRIERLIHEELRYYRYKLESCQCQKTHHEWFQVEEVPMLLAITRWVGWVGKDPYLGTQIDQKWKWTFQETALVSLQETLDEVVIQLDADLESNAGQRTDVRRSLRRRSQPRAATSTDASVPSSSNNSSTHPSTDTADPEALQPNAEQSSGAIPVTPLTSPSLPALTPDISDSRSESPLSTPTPSARSPVLSYITGLIWPQAGSLSPGCKASDRIDEDPFFVPPPGSNEEIISKADSFPRRPTLPMPGEWPRLEHILD
ncbi:hypothetical protein MMC10_003270 [Thelotrema lepadinum]|nr:hypothetical protein [Thelotrema lepadinum]